MTKTHKFNLTGATRKPLIKAIESFANVKGVYQGAPKFGYAFYGVGVLDKEGALHFDCDMQVIMDCVTWLEEQGFTCDTKPEETPRFEDLPLTEREELGLGLERHDPAGEDGMQASDVPVTEIHALRNFGTAGGNAEDGTFAVEIPLDGFTPEKLDNLVKLIESKRELIKTAIGTDSGLPVVQTADGRLRFEWFPYTEDADEVTAYSTLVCKLCEAAKEQKRVTAKEKPVDNAKFAFRVFLIRLGFIGDEYKKSRKFLLRNLSGNSAFKNGAPPKVNESEVQVDE